MDPFENDQQRSVFIGLLLYEAYGKSFGMKKLSQTVSNFINQKCREYCLVGITWSDDWNFNFKIFDPYSLQLRGREFKSILIAHPDFAKWLTNSGSTNPSIDRILGSHPVYSKKHLSLMDILLDGYKIFKVLYNYLQKPARLDPNLEIILSTFLLKCATNPVSNARVKFLDRKLFYAKILTLSLIPSINYLIEDDLMMVISKFNSPNCPYTEESYMIKYCLGLLAAILNSASPQNGIAIAKNQNLLKYFCNYGSTSFPLTLFTLLKLILNPKVKEMIHNELIELNPSELQRLATMFPSAFSLVSSVPHSNGSSDRIYNLDLGKMIFILLPDNEMLITTNPLPINTKGDPSYYAIAASQVEYSKEYLQRIKTVLSKAKRLTESKDELARYFLASNQIIHFN